MEITWYGLSCFRITERGRATLITDPFDESAGLPVPKLRGDVITISHQAAGHSNIAAVANHKFVIDAPGEYEIEGVFITGISTVYQPGMTRNVLYLFDYEELTVAHVGDITKVPTQSQIEALGEVNVLLLPVGGGRSLNAVQAAELVSMIEPNIVVPMHYKTPGLQLELDGIERFLNEMGQTNVEELPTLKTTRSSLPEDTQTILLTPKY